MKKLTTTMMQETLHKQDRHLTVGLDLGDRSSFYCVLDEAGDVLMEQRLSTRQGDKRDLRSDASEPHRTGDRNAFTVGKPVA
jgi:D-serine dehydratase